ncbi:BTAD domain-containing putative transcriptional regulator [Streptosporangium sp. 'caverna']|uniref:AfsR/SARP family transcriptional regulator n=1 Tax=Streptosporangium sp. 'caverna' TaxID=2202249 RepID=UPI000D7D9084|nr:BTAD domain-containing putative transcriptional regulator [Streptosporangium sp. 'caverna']AWS44380.1 AfsR family transcriptional regulator [Streptosporangium sp. 'caverna']
MQIGMLGSLEVRADGGAVTEMAGARLRTLLIVLALEPDRVVSTARLVDGVWGSRPPVKAVNALQALASRLRRVLPEARIESHPAGYRLAIEPDAVDVARFERLVAAGRSALADDAAAAARILREALGLWRGPALMDVADADFFAAPVARLSELRLVAVEDRIEADLRLGRGGELTVELTSLVAEHPLRERPAGALMRALCAAGRPAEALAVYERARETLAEALGADPSPELSALHTAVLRGEVGVAARPVPEAEADGRSRTNLRAGLTSFVGRDSEVAQVGKLVGEHRLTTLTGPGGSGKTRLAGETARALLERMTDGVWLVELAPVGDGGDVPQAVLSALGVREQALTGRAPVGEPIDRLAAALRTRSALLVLDNCEHLIGAAAALADRLLGECPRLRILATSREPLGIVGEALWPVEPLGLPPRDAGAAEALSHPSVRLLSDRAGAARPGFTVSERTAPAVVRICRALDGMPLAIELAAARLRTMTAEQLADRLDDRFRLLTGGGRTALPRHRTLRAAVDWSWDLLAEEERTLLRRLAVFSGGATAEAAERVCMDGAVPADLVPDLLGALADKSLLVASGDGTERYRMLETIREYCLERLEEAGERDRIRRAHAACFVELAETADPHLRRAGQLLWLPRLAADHDNINAAVRGAIAAGDARTAVRLVAAAGWYWYLDWALSGRKAEGAALAAEALAMPGAVDDEVRATACAISALFELNGLGDESRARDWLATAERLAERTEHRHPVLRLVGALGRVPWGARTPTAPPVDAVDPLADEDPWVRATARLNRALTLVAAGRRHAEAEADFQAALAEFRALDERLGISSALTALAGLAEWRGDLATAVSCYEQAVAAVTEVVPGEDVWLMRLRLAQLRWLLGDTEGSAAAMAQAERDTERIGLPDALVAVAYAKAELARWTGEPRTARTQLTRAEELSRHLTVNWQFRAMIRGSLGYLDAGEGDLDAARAHHADALVWALRSRSAPTISQTLVGIADLALHRGRPHEAARLLAASAAVRGTPELSQPDAARVEAATRAALGEEEFAEAARRGADATVETVREIAAVTLGSSRLT